MGRGAPTVHFWAVPTYHAEAPLNQAVSFLPLSLDGRELLLEP